MQQTRPRFVPGGTLLALAKNGVEALRRDGEWSHEKQKGGSDHG